MSKKVLEEKKCIEEDVPDIPVGTPMIRGWNFKVYLEKEEDNKTKITMINKRAENKICKFTVSNDSREPSCYDEIIEDLELIIKGLKEYKSNSNK